MLPKVAFISTHNDCRSQIAQALGRHLAGNVFESYSGGTEPNDAINSDAVRLMKDIYNIDMEKDQTPKLVSALPSVDIVIATGCGEACPFLPCRYMEHWEIDDPAGKGDEVFKQVIKSIEEKVLDLQVRVQDESIFSEEALF